MRTACAFVLVIAVAALSRGADDKKKADRKANAPKAAAPKLKKPDHPLYWYNVFPSLLGHKNLPGDLKATPAQEQALKDAQKAWRDGFVKQVEGGKPIDFEAINTAQYNGMLEYLGKSFDEKQVKRIKQITLQEHGMTLLNYQEVRDALGLTDGDVDRMRKAHDEARKELKAKYNVMPREEYYKRDSDMFHGVTAKARAVLTEDQQKRLTEWIGPQFAFK